MTREKVILGGGMWVNMWERMLGVKIFVRHINFHQRAPSVGEEHMTWLVSWHWPVSDTLVLENGHVNEMAIVTELGIMSGLNNVGLHSQSSYCHLWMSNYSIPGTKDEPLKQHHFLRRPIATLVAGWLLHVVLSIIAGPVIDACRNRYVVSVSIFPLCL